uniref:Ig-like domain-containing protein n=1 Tax=Periophthalmus magnuspinnatus TaxID=409849 RepID=A0A3B4AVV3_9GOBI
MSLGVWSGNWRVTVQSQCALRGSTVVLQCYYDYPLWHTVKHVKWFKGRLQDTGSSYALESLTVSRFEYVGDKDHNCDLKIKNVQSIDEGLYFFMFETSRDRWRSRNPPYLFVQDLIAFVSPTVVAEGEVVTLTCHSGCNPNSNIQVVWYKERQEVTQTRFTARRENTGTYTCALRGQEHVRSSVSLNVQYAPKNVKLSISPPTDIIQGRTVTFTCSSEANPIVTSSGYSLYKDGHFISFGPSHRISEVQPSDSGQYYCQAWNNISRTGSNLFQSFKTILNVLYPPINISISVELTEVTEGSDVNLTCDSMANPPPFGFMWYRTSSSSVVQVGSGPVLSLSSVEASSSGLYMCQALNRIGESNSTQLRLSVKSKYRMPYLCPVFERDMCTCRTMTAIK